MTIKNNNIKLNNSFDSMEITPYEFNGIIKYGDLSCLIDYEDDIILPSATKKHNIFELGDIDWDEINKKISTIDFNKIQSM